MRKYFFRILVHEKKRILLLLTVDPACRLQPGCKRPKRLRNDCTNTRKELALVKGLVKGAIESLTGICPLGKDRSKLQEAVGNPSGVKPIINQTTVAPVVFTSDYSCSNR